MGTELLIPTVGAMSTATCSPAETDAMLEAEWTSRHGSLCEITREVYGKDGFDVRFIGFKPPAMLDPEMIEIIDAASRPAAPDFITHELARVRVATAGRTPNNINMAAWLIVVGEELERYPADVIREACRRWTRREKWTPAVAELVDECERLMARRRALRDAARKAAAGPNNRGAAKATVQLADVLASVARRWRTDHDLPPAPAAAAVPHHRPDAARLRRVFEETRGMQLVKRGAEDRPGQADAEEWGG